MAGRPDEPVAPLERWLAPRRRWPLFLLGLTGLLVLSAADHRGLLLRPANDRLTYDGRRVLVVVVLDGQTLEIAQPDGRRPVTRIRLLGVATPEPGSVELGIPPDPFAAAALARLRALSEGRHVHLRLDAQSPRDRSGALLAYVELPDGTLLNERLLVAGLAKAVPQRPHRLEGRFEMLQRQAWHDRSGMWKQR